MKQDNIKEEIAAELLRIGAVFLRPDDPFVWASGIQSPIYCDNRLVLSDPAARTAIEHTIAGAVRLHFPAAAVLMGTSTAGIAHAAIAAHILGLPMGYVRSGSKDHGRMNRIEGKLEAGDKTVIIEDLISTGGSVIETAEALRSAGADVLGVVSIFTYGMEKGRLALARAGLANHSLCDLDALLPVAVGTGRITQTQAAQILAFRDDPSGDWRNIK